MSEFGGALDRWLEAPYTDAARREADFEQWCEATDTDPEADDAWDRFDAAIDAEQGRMEDEAHEVPEAYDTESDIREDAHRERLARNTRRLLKGD